MSEGDPTDHVLAAIASILDKSETSDKPASDESNPDDAAAAPEQSEFHLAEEELTPSPPTAETPPTVPGEAEAAGYTRYGPGPLAAIRFKWATRRDDNGGYFVDETIGENSHPLVSGPMTREAAIKFVDDHERLARERFEALRSEMAGGEIGRNGDEHS